jgi:predicted secreted protein
LHPRRAGRARDGPRSDPAANEGDRLALARRLNNDHASGKSIEFKWRLNTAQSTNLAIIRVIDRGYQAAQSGLMGSPGSHRWEIKARAPGTASVVFAYARPWEHGPPAETHVIQVSIAPRP